MVAVAGVLAACATGVDSADINAGDDGGGAVVEGSPGVDAAHANAPDSSAAQDTGSSTTADTGSGGDDASPGDDAASSQETSSAQDSATAQDTGTTVPETSTGQDTGTTGGTCPGGAKYGIEAAAEVASGNITLCLSGVCSAGLCCYTGANPANICVAQ